MNIHLCEFWMKILKIQILDEYTFMQFRMKNINIEVPHPLKW
jgi:hypothetical protein